MVEIIPQILESMQQHGILPTEEIIADGELHRFHIENDNPAKRNGWVVINAENIPTAFYGSWRTGNKHFWQSYKPVTAEERKAAKLLQDKMRQQYQASQREKQGQAAETARILIERAVPADPEHAYLLSKHINPYNALQLEGILLVPLHYRGELVSLQAIYKDGSKQFLKGGKVKSCSFSLTRKKKKVIICEGYSTGCTLQEHYPDSQVIIAFTAGNLVSVARQHSDANLVVAGDNDQWNKDGNAGVKAARAAAAVAGADLMIPDFAGLDLSSKPTDYNDLVSLGGVL